MANVRCHPHPLPPNQRAKREHAMSKTVKDLKIKTKSLHRCAEPLLRSARATRCSRSRAHAAPHRIMKDMEYTEKEIVSQQNRIQSVGEKK